MMDQSGGVLLKNGGAENKLRMGVTTRHRAARAARRSPAAEIPDYFKRLESQGIAINFGTYYATHSGAA